MAEAIVAFDLPRFTYFSPTGGRRGASVFISTYPTSWTDHYFAQGYDALDPVFTVAHAREEPFHWGKDVATLEQNKAQKKLFDEAAAFGIRNGLTFPLACRSRSFAALTVVADEKPSTFKRRIENPLPLLQFMAIAFHSAVRQKPCITHAVNGVPLTPRELECLQWTARGKNAWEIGCIIGVRPCTVTFHLENAKQKLGVRSLYQAVAAFTSGDSVGDQLAEPEEESDRYPETDSGRRDTGRGQS